LSINNSGYLFRYRDEVIFNEFAQQNKKNLLLQINKSEDSNYEFIPNEFTFDNEQNIEYNNNCFFVFKKSKMLEKTVRYKINLGDIIRFGRITTRIKAINIKKNKNDENESFNINGININNNSLEQNLLKPEEKKVNILHYSTDFNRINTAKILKEEKKLVINTPKKINVYQSVIRIPKTKLAKICRICYEEEDPKDEEKNPLVQACHCSGSLKYIHLECLKQWLLKKSCIKREKNDKYSLFIVKTIECELCKTKFPDFIKHKDKIYEILDLRSEFENNLIIESLSKDKNNDKILFVINLDFNNKIKIGRGHDADINLLDVSISRLHSTLTIDKRKNIFIEDNDSKFGTLILVQSKLKLIENLPLFIQTGRTFLDCRINSSSYNLFSCCGISEKPNINSYFEQNKNKKAFEDMLLIQYEKENSEEIEEEDDFLDKNQDIIFKKKDEDKKNDRYDDTYDFNNVKTGLKVYNEDKINELKLISSKKSLFDNKENKDNEATSLNKGDENNKKNEDENIEKKSNKLIDNCDSIILESEDDIAI